MVCFDFDHSSKKKKNILNWLCVHVKFRGVIVILKQQLCVFSKWTVKKLLFFCAKKVLYTEFQDSFSKATTRAR